MAKARAETTIDRSADEVWERIRDFGDVSWVPNTESCTLDGDVRRIRMRGADSDVVQRLTRHDDEQRTLSYMMNRADFDPFLGPDHVVQGLEATLVVTPTGATTTWVTFDVDTADSVVDAVHESYQEAMDNLKSSLET